MADEPFRPHDCEVALSDDGQFLRLIFSRDSGERQEVAIPLGQAPALLTLVQRKIAPGQGVPIDQGSFRSGRTYNLQGYEVRKRQDGSAVLNLFADLPDQGRVVAVPLELSPKEVAGLIERLSV